MQIVLFDIDPNMTDAWKKEFQEDDDVIIENTEFSQLMNSRKYKFDTVVSASNSFGIMDGGLDKAYANYWPQLEKNVRRAIHEAFLDEQPVGTSLIVEIPKTRGMRLIHTVTMRTPMPVFDVRIVYTAMRSSLVAAYKANSSWVLIPAFCHLTGGVGHEITALLMHRAYADFNNSLKGRFYEDMTWETINAYRVIDDALIGRFI